MNVKIKKATKIEFDAEGTLLVNGRPAGFDYIYHSLFFKKKMLYFPNDKDIISCRTMLRLYLAASLCYDDKEVAHYMSIFEKSIF